MCSLFRSFAYCAITLIRAKAQSWLSIFFFQQKIHPSVPNNSELVITQAPRAAVDDSHQENPIKIQSLFSLFRYVTLAQPTIKANLPLSTSQIMQLYCLVQCPLRHGWWQLHRSSSAIEQRLDLSLVTNTD